MNIRELKRRLQPYTGYMKPAEDGGADGGGTATEEKLDMGNDLDPAQPDDQAAAEEGGAGGDGGDPPAGSVTEAEGEDGTDGQGGRRASGIPKARFNEVNEERKEALRKLEAAEQELERLRAATAKPASAAPAQATAAPVAPAQSDSLDVDAKEQEYAEALYAGDGKKAAAIRREINEHLVEQATTKAREVAATEFTVRETKTLLQAAVQTTLAAYPWLNDPEGAEAADLIVAYRDQLHRKGVPLHLALQEAVNKIAPKFAPEETTPSRVSEKPEPARDLRTAAAIARGTADSALQPPAVQAGIGNRATPNRIDWKSLDEDQFAAVSKDELRKALGNA